MSNNMEARKTINKYEKYIKEGNKKNRKTINKYEKYIKEGNKKKIEDFQSKNTMTDTLTQIGLFSGAKYGNLEVIKYHMPHVASIDIEDLNYIVVIAVDNGHLEVLRYLYNCGLSVSAYENMAIRRATSNGNLEIVKFLTEHNADIYEDNKSLIVIVVHEDNFKVVKLNKKSVNNLSSENSAFSIAVVDNNKEILRYFVSDLDKEVPHSMIEWLKTIPEIEGARYALQLIESKDMAKQLESTLSVKNEPQKQRTKI